MSKRTWRDMSDKGSTVRMGPRKGLKTKRPKFRTKEDAEEDRKQRTGVRTRRRDQD